MGGTARLFDELFGEAGEDPPDTDEPDVGQDDTTGDRYDVWGAKRNIGMAVGQVAGVNAIVWFFNEFIRGGNFTAVNPRSWWKNLSSGFFYDDNHFDNNMFAHPYHGSLYFNAARSNGLNYFESLGFTVLGSFMWECCGETHLMAWNDWVMTSLAGGSIGEMLYRAGSGFLDNERAGTSRTLKEVGNFFLNPMRGFNRLVSGRSGRIYPNPADPYDRIPPNLRTFVKAGVRIIGDNSTSESFETDTTFTTGFFGFDMNYGNVFEDTRRKPFDFFELGFQLNFGDKTSIGRLQIHGNLYTSDIAKGEKSHHVFAITQNYDYINNTAIEFGGMSYGAAFFSRFKMGEKWNFQTNVNLHLYLLSAVDSEFAFVGGRPPNTELFREYDFGIGPGAWVRFGFTYRGHEVVNFLYRLTFSETLNGSNVNGANTHHTIQWGGIQGVFPIGRWGIGADVYAYVRRSYFESAGFADIRQDVGQVRFYGVYQSF